MNSMMRHLSVLFLLLVGNAVCAAEEQNVLSIVQANFEAADKDGDESLDSTEFRSLINANAESKIGRASMVRRFGAYDRAFKTADRDSDGRVTWSEILANGTTQNH